jgi:hypothetical protein
MTILSTRVERSRNQVERVFCSSIIICGDKEQGGVTVMLFVWCKR